MLTYSLTFDEKVITDIIDDLAAAPRRLQQIVATRVKDQLERDIEPLRTEPPEPDYPFIWSLIPALQARARAWWFAYLKRTGKLKAGGGKHKRTHGLVQGWQVDVNAFRASVSLSVYNPAVKAVKWTQSVFQVPSHKRSGWSQYEDVLLRAEEKAADNIVNAWFDVLVEGMK